MSNDEEVVEYERKHQESIAYHEAGHVVVAYTMGRQICFVTIETKEEMHRGNKVLVRGKARYADWWKQAGASPDEITLEIVQQEVCISLGGLIANQIQDRVRHENKHWADYGATSDRDDIKASWRSAIGKFGEEKCVEASKFLRKRTRKLLMQPGNWAAVEALAHELLPRETLSGEEAKRTIREARKAYRGRKHTAYEY